MKGYKQYLQYLAMTIATVFAVNGFVVGEVIIYILIGIFTITTLFCLAVSIGYNALVKKDIKHHTEKSKTAVDDLLKTCTIPRLIIGHVFSSIVPIILIYNGWLWTPIIYIIGYILFY